MNIDSNTKKSFIIVLVIIGMLVFFGIFSRFLFGDNRKFPVESDLNKKMTINNYDFALADPKWDKKQNLLQFEVEWFCDDFQFNANPTIKNTWKVYYADPKQEIKSPKFYYETRLEEYKPAKDQIQQKIVFTIQTTLSEDVTKKLGVVFENNMSQPKWDETTESEYYESLGSKQFGLDYRDFQYVELTKINKSTIDEDSRNHYYYLESVSKPVNYTSDGLKVAEEEGHTNEETLDIMNQNIKTKQEEIKGKKKEIGELQETLSIAQIGEEEWTKGWNDESFITHQKKITNAQNDLSDLEKELADLQGSKDQYLKEHPDLETINSQQEVDYGI